MRQAQPRSITILHTNDIHSHFEMASPIAALISSEREHASGNPLLLFDIGDHMDRTAYETEGTMGQVNTDILNLTGYDAVTIGNNEGLTFTPEQLAEVYSGLLAPIVCSNIVEQATGEPPVWMKRSTIIVKDGIRIGITGATAPFVDFYELLGLHVFQPSSAIREQVEILRPQTDIIIVLSHLGLATDRLLAEELQHIDLILGGHTHHLLEEPEYVGRTAICGAGKFGQYVGKIILQERHDGSFQVTHGECIPVDPAYLNEDISRSLVIHRARAEEALQETVAVVERELPLRYDGESLFGNLLAQSVRQFTKAQLSIVNTGQLLGPLPKGEISAGMLHKLCPSPINPCLIQMKGRDIRQALEESLLPAFQLKEIKGFGFRGQVLGNIAVDGIEVLYDPTQIPYYKIVQIRLDGEPLRDEAEYCVGTLDMFTFGIGYESISAGKHPKYLLPEFLRDLLRFELQRPGSLHEIDQSRWVKIH